MQRNSRKELFPLVWHDETIHVHVTTAEQTVACERCERSTVVRRPLQLDRPLVVGGSNDKPRLPAVLSWKLSSACDWVGHHNQE